MCGIVGFLHFHGLGDPAADIIRRMTAAIPHRGPDADAVWCEGPVAFGHRRLSILDLSPAGAQPMESACGRYVIAFNGEIYNYRDIRAEIEADAYFPSVIRQWRGHSDTEVILAAVGRWGLMAALQRLVGMFAIALWDRQENTLFLARDRAGEKPLYVGRRDGLVVFGSELKALRAYPGFRPELDRGALALYMRHNYVPAPYSIYQGVRKVMPGTVLRVDLSGDEASETFWSLPKSLPDLRSHPVMDPQEAVDGLEAVLSRAVGEQMVADVPIGAFLSGGIDSSTIVALMQAQSSRPVKSFSIGFHEDGYNEAQHARAVATHLGTDHTELYVTAEQAMAVIPKLPAIYDEPFADSSQIPTFLVAQLARGHVTVSLSGDAGDELFSGYNRYTMTSALWGKITRIPAPLRRLATRAVTAVPPSLLNTVGRMIPGQRFGGVLGDKLHKGAALLGCVSVDEVYRGLVSHWPDPADVVIGGREHPTPLMPGRGAAPDLTGLDPVERMMALDFLTYLPDDILVKVDRAAMAVSLETRVPMLDHRVIQYAWGLPQSVKQRDGVGKWVLRQVLYRHVPQKLMDRPKMGFGVPIDAWLRGPLAGWAEDLLNPERLSREGFFDPAPIRRKWDEHRQGKRNWAYHLWDVLMFQAWLESQ